MFVFRFITLRIHTIFDVWVTECANWRSLYEPVCRLKLDGLIRG